MSRTRISLRDNVGDTLYYLMRNSDALYSSSWLISVLLTCLFTTSATAFFSTSHSSISYTVHCKAVVPESPTEKNVVGVYQFLALQNAYFVGGNPIFEEILKSDDDHSPRSLDLRPTRFHRTISDTILAVEANLVLRNAKLLSFSSGNSTIRRGLRFLVTPRFPIRRGLVSFRLRGFWSSASGNLCMVGSGSSYAKDGKLHNFNAVLKLNYLNRSSILTSLVTGTLESVDASGSLNYFEPVSILGASLMNYDYTLIEKQHEINGFSEFDKYENVSLGLSAKSDACTLLHHFSHAFKLTYASECNSVICNPFGRSSDLVPSFMSIRKIQCLGEKLRALIGFSSYGYYGRSLPFDPKSTLVAEGLWDSEKNRMCFIACRIFNFTNSLTDASLGDCTIKSCLRFPSMLSLRKRSSVVGEIWSSIPSSGFNYDNRIKFRDSGKSSLYLPGLKYEYSETNTGLRFCKKVKPKEHKNKIYPDGNSVNMKLDMSVKSSGGKKGFGRIIPLSIADRLYSHTSLSISSEPESAAPSYSSPSGLLNVSYEINLLPSLGFRSTGKNDSIKPFDISAEGTYDTDTGVLCMVGCRHFDVNKTSIKTGGVDCEIHIIIQYSSLNRMDGSSMEGRIQSSRESTDNLYFEPYLLSSNSFYTNQAEESIWRMDLEIIMVVGSNTLACIFIGLQLFHVKRNLDVLPFISIVMVLVLILGHMIPLVLNFEVILDRRGSFLGNRREVQVNEIVVRGVTLIPILLLCRLLQLTWASRGNVESKQLRVSERKVLFLCLQFYVTVGLIGWFVRRKKNESNDQHVFWGILRSYASVASDTFLIPQIVFNMLINMRNRVLSPGFYIGTTFLHLLPHIYVLYRTLGFSSSFNLSYIYANPKMDLYSTFCDGMILSCGLLFVVFVYLQQRFGGRAILPKRLRERFIYEQIPGIITE